MKKKMIAAGLGLGLALASVAQAATFVLVHGAWGDAGAWGMVAPLLEKQGHTVRTVNLPGQGRDNTVCRPATCPF
jgi:alpha-beta hydrolase superfamily lysophospholipase